MRKGWLAGISHRYARYKSPKNKIVTGFSDRFTWKYLKNVFLISSVVNKKKSFNLRKLAKGMYFITSP